MFVAVYLRIMVTINKNPLLVVAIILLASFAQNVLAQDLYVGTQGGPFGKGAVYKYGGSSGFTNISEGTDVGQAVMDIKAFSGTVYIATQTSSGYGGSHGAGQVFKFQGNNEWLQVGEKLGTSCMALVVYRNQLHAICTDMSDRNGLIGKLYRYENEPDKWTLVGSHAVYNSRTGAYCMGFSRAVVSSIRGFEEIFIGDLDKDSFYRYNPDEGLSQVDENWRSCVYSITEHDKKLYSGCWHGAFYECSDGNNFVRKVYLNNYNHIWATGVYKDQLYAGTGNGYAFNKSSRQGELRKWNGASLELVQSFPVSKYAEGVTSLATDGQVLFLGTGIPDGYYAGDSSMAEVYKYDGVTFERISGADAFGGGVQSLLVSSPLSPSIELLEISAKLTIVARGGHVFVSAKSRGFLVNTIEESLYFDLPREFYLQSIDGPPNGDGLFSAVISAGCKAKKGIHKISAYIVARGENGDVIHSNKLSFEIKVVKKIQDIDTEQYRILQEGIIQTMVFDLNLENSATLANFPKYVDLSAVGIMSKESRQEVKGQKGYSQFFYTQVTNFYGNSAVKSELSEHGLISNTLDVIAASHQGFIENLWLSDNSGFRLDFSFETRPYIKFDVNIPSEGFRLVSAVVSFSSGNALPAGEYYFNINDVLEYSFPSAQHVFVDSGDRTMISSYKLGIFSYNTVDVSSLILGSSFIIGFDLLEEASPARVSTRSYSDETSVFNSSSRNSAIYVLQGTAPTLNLIYSRGYSTDEIFQMMLEDLRFGDGSKAAAIGKLVNSFGKDAASLGIGCECKKKCRHTGQKRCNDNDKDDRDDD